MCFRSMISIRFLPIIDQYGYLWTVETLGMQHASCIEMWLIVELC